MKGCKQPRGFTIIEVMIVLGVSGALLLAAFILVAGKQSKTGFTTSIYDFKTEMQQISNDVINGYYPKYSNFTCTQNGNGASVPTGPPTINTTASGNGQGGNGGINSSTGALSGCTFIGKAVQLAVGGSPSSNVDIYPIAGNLEGSGGLPASSISDSYPVLLAPGTNNNPNFSSEFIVPYTISYQLHPVWMCYSITYGVPCNQSSSNTTAVVVFATSPTGSNSVTSPSYAQEIDFAAIPNTSIAVGAPVKTSHDMVDTIDNYFKTTLANNYIINPAGGIEICVADNNTNQSGLLTIGGSNGPTTINLHVIGGDTNCT